MSSSSVKCSLVLDTSALDSAVDVINRRLDGSLAPYPHMHTTHEYLVLLIRMADLEEQNRQREDSTEEKILELVQSMSDRLTQLEARVLATADVEGNDSKGFADKYTHLHSLTLTV